MDWLNAGLLLLIPYLAAFCVGWWVQDYIMKDYW
jgi:hypothetical protein